jgi:hypothetical protein
MRLGEKVTINRERPTKAPLWGSRILRVDACHVLEPRIRFGGGVREALLLITLSKHLKLSESIGAELPEF